MHHIVPVSRDGASHPSNLVKLVDSYHIAIHRVFSNDTPTEQINRLLTINDTALCDEFKHKIRAILDKDPDWIYNAGILIPRK